MAKVLLPMAEKLCNTIMKDFPGMIIKKWQYDAGLCLLGFDAVYKETGNKALNDYIHTFYDYFIHDDGTIETYDPQVRNIDHINCGKNLFLLLEEYVPVIRKIPRWLGRIYTLLVVCVGFVLFRAETLEQGGWMISRMFTGFDASSAAMSLHAAR